MQEDMMALLDEMLPAGENMGRMTKPMLSTD